MCRYDYLKEIPTSKDFGISSSKNLYTSLKELDLASPIFDSNYIPHVTVDQQYRYVISNKLLNLGIMPYIQNFNGGLLTKEEAEEAKMLRYCLRNHPVEMNFIEKIFLSLFIWSNIVSVVSENNKCTFSVNTTVLDALLANIDTVSIPSECLGHPPVADSGSVANDDAGGDGGAGGGGGDTTDTTDSTDSTDPFKKFKKITFLHLINFLEKFAKIDLVTLEYKPTNSHLVAFFGSSSLIMELSYIRNAITKLSLQNTYLSSATFQLLKHIENTQKASQFMLNSQHQPLMSKQLFPLSKKQILINNNSRLFVTVIKKEGILIKKEGIPSYEIAPDEELPTVICEKEPDGMSICHYLSY